MPETKVLLVGPYPPPHGGISVHVAALARALEAEGAQCRILNLDPRAKPDPAYQTLRGGLDLVRIVSDHARAGFAVHLHTNGHGFKSWLIAAACAVAGRRAPAVVVTLHSGMLPSYLDRAGALVRAFVQCTCLAFTRIVCVNPAIRAALLSRGVPSDRLLVRAAFLPVSAPKGALPRDLDVWMSSREPVLSTALFFRPEYGVDVLVEAVDRLRVAYPRLGCVVMGSGDPTETERQLEARGLGEHVRLAGDLGHDDCLKVMARSDVFVRPTRADGDSISVREALALGVSTVASDVGTRPDGARLFPAGDVDAFVHVLAQVVAARSVEEGADAPAVLLG
jgi:glycogen synthase